MVYNFGSDHDTICLSLGQFIVVNSQNIPAKLEVHESDGGENPVMVIGYQAQVNLSTLNTALPDQSKQIFMAQPKTWKNAVGVAVELDSQTMKILSCVVTSDGTAILEIGNQ